MAHSVRVSLKPALQSLLNKMEIPHGGTASGTSCWNPPLCTERARSGVWGAGIACRTTLITRVVRCAAVIRNCGTAHAVARAWTVHVKRTPTYRASGIWFIWERWQWAMIHASLRVFWSHLAIG